MNEDISNAYQRKKILITGGAGAIGSNLTLKFSELGVEKVIVLDDLSSSCRWNIPDLPDVSFIEGDLLDAGVLGRAFAESPDYVFHLAAFFANQNSVDHPERDLMVNGMGTLKLLQAARQAEVEKFIYASSGCSIYGSSAPMPLKEEFVSLYLSSPYQITKMLGELYCNFFNLHYGVKTVKPRFFNSYGPGEVPGCYRNVIPNFIYWALLGQALPITGTGEETRDFTYVGDIVSGLLSAGVVEEAVGEGINLASGEEVRIIDLANLINELTGNKAGIRYIPRRRWDTKPRLLASIEKAADLLGYTPGMSFREGIRKNLAWFRENWEAIEAAADFRK
ncbi:MAG: NAD-dependent epimerase/dehydratase family protein [Candidatus Auribacterota bacterium]|nr:NAD-dependent epimerase/dehydratase family protein [Candidatus Auribacterota bacterium]